MAHGHHITPRGTLLKVFGGLVALTIFTVLTAQIDMGAFNVPLALVIALTKASLVVLFFMALKYDNRVNTLVFSVGTVFVIVFLVFTMFDTEFRGDLGNVAGQTIQDELREQEVLRGRIEQAGGTTAADTTAAAPDTTAADTTGAAADTTDAEAADTTDAE